MKRSLLIAACILNVAAFAVRAEDDRKLQKIGDHVWAYENVTPMTTARSFGANAGLIVGEKGALVVDTLTSANEGKKLLADVRSVTKRPVLWVVNTHYHLDHAWGNCVFAAEGAKIVGAAPAPKLFAERGQYGLDHADQYGLSKSDIEGTTLAPPEVSFAGTMEIDLGSVAVELRSLPHGHCADNLIVYVPKDNVLFSGDLLFVGCHPFLGEGDIPNWLADLDVLASLNAQKIVPGHGPLAASKDIAEMKDYLKIFDENALKLTQGKPASDAPQIAEALQKILPAQNRTQLSRMIESNLRLKYLPQEKPNP